VVNDRIEDWQMENTGTLNVVFGERGLIDIVHRIPLRLEQIFTQVRTDKEGSCRAGCTVLRLLQVLGWNLDPETGQELSHFSHYFQEHSVNMCRK
jgi:hypothetical protein